MPRCPRLAPFLVVAALAQVLGAEDSGGEPPEACASGGGGIAAGSCGLQKEAAIAAVLRGVVSERELGQLENLRARAEKSRNRRLVRQRRNFGESAYHGGHEVTYLHRHVWEPALEGLWAHARAALAAMPAWRPVEQAAQKAFGEEHPTLRCLEAISYFKEGSGDARKPAKPSKPAQQDDPNVLAWHDDGSTLVTLAVALTTAGEDYQGGELEFRRPGGQRQLVADLRRGDVVAWRGWDEHRVRPVSSGRREVVVAEWWLGRSPTSHDFRPQDQEDDIRKILQHVDSTAAPLHHTLASAILADRNDEDAAAESLREALRWDPQRADSHIGLAVVYGRQNNAPAVERSLLDALEVDPQSVLANYMLGEISEDRRDFPEAEKRYREALRLDPAHADSTAGLGTVLMGQRKRAADAEGLFRKAVRAKPASVKAQVGLGMALGKRGEHAGARASFEAAVRVAPSHPGARVGLGTALASVGDLTGAGESWLAALSLDPQNDAAQRNLQWLQSSAKHSA